LALERTLLGAIRKDDGGVPPPQIYTRDNAAFVEADEFLDWLAQYVLETGTRLVFPADLARAVDRKVSKHAGRQPFRSLTKLLETYFNGDVGSLPSDIRAFVDQVYSPFDWHMLTPDQRRSFADQYDVQHDPARQGEHCFWWRHVVKEQELEKSIEEWERLSGATVSERAEKRKQLEALRYELHALNQKAARTRDLLSCGNPSESEQAELGDQVYISCPQAIHMLEQRFGAGVHELAMWIFLGAKNGGLDAFAGGGGSAPARFHLGYSDDLNYVTPMMGCRFRRSDIETFVPSDRYELGIELVARWSKIPGMVDVAGFIRAKIGEGVLQDMHPISGMTQWSYPGTDFRASLDEAIFSLSEIEAIEAADFALEPSGESDRPAASKPVLVWEIYQRFALARDEDENVAWWKGRMADAGRYDLLECRAAKGRPGIRDSSLWYPDRIAGWLVDKGHMTGRKAAQVLREHFPDCADTADRLDEPE
jgi:hypothetical protein